MGDCADSIMAIGYATGAFVLRIEPLRVSTKGFNPLSRETQMTGKRGQVAKGDLADMKVRLPSALKLQVQQASQARGSSMNGEIVERLERSFAADTAGQDALQTYSLVSAAMRHYHAMTPQERAALWDAGRLY